MYKACVYIYYIYMIHMMNVNQFQHSAWHAHQAKTSAKATISHDKWALASSSISRNCNRWPCFPGTGSPLMQGAICWIVEMYCPRSCKLFFSMLFRYVWSSTVSHLCMIHAYIYIYTYKYTYTYIYIYTHGVYIYIYIYIYGVYIYIYTYVFAYIYISFFIILWLLFTVIHHHTISPRATRLTMQVGCHGSIPPEPRSGSCHFYWTRPGKLTKTMDNCHRNSGYTHWKWWFCIVMLVYPLVD